MSFRDWVMNLRPEQRNDVDGCLGHVLRTSEGEMGLRSVLPPARPSVRRAEARTLCARERVPCVVVTALVVCCLSFLLISFSFSFPP